MNLPLNPSELLARLPGLFLVYAINPKGDHQLLYVSTSLRQRMALEAPAPLAASEFWRGVNVDCHTQQTLWGDAISNHRSWQGKLTLACDQDGIPDTFDVMVEPSDLQVDGISATVTFTAIKMFRSAQYLQSILDVLPDRFYYKDRRSRFMGGNKAWIAGKGFKNISELKGKTDVQINRYAPGVGEELLRDEQEQMANGDSRHFREAHRDVDGKELFLDSIKIPLKNEQGEVIGLAGMTRVVTEQVLMERELIKAKEIAESTCKAKDSFLAIMSHEIRTPLNGILGCSSLLAETNLDLSQKQLIKTVLNCGETLLLLVNDILDYSKIDGRHIELEKNPFSLRSLIESVLDVFMHSAEVKHIKLSHFIPDHIPNTLIGDELRLRQILTNLIGNAIKFTEQGSICVRVDVFVQHKDRCELKFTIEDTGIGIPKESQLSIFELFQQADVSTTRKYGGTGLGLAICRRLVELKGGKIWLYSEEGKGSRFHFTACYGCNNEVISDKLLNQKQLLHSKRALIVDDNNVNCDILVSTLAQWQVKSRAFADPKDALMHLKIDKYYDFILLDYSMPDLDGITLAENIRSLPDFKSTPIIVLTSAMIKPCVSECIDAVLAKPIRADDLAKTIADQILKKSSKKNLQKTINQEQKSAVKILIAEDDAVNIMVCEMMLRRLGYSNIAIVNDGVEALAEVSTHSFDIIFMDIQMPNMDGIEATKAIRLIAETHEKPWIIALTAGALESDSRLALSAGMNQFITKPVQLDALRAVMEETLVELHRKGLL